MFSKSALCSVVQLVLSLSPYTDAARIPVRNAGQSTVAVTLGKGNLEGVSSSAYGQDFFLGIPYAQPPVGELRFRKPQPAASWDGTRAVHEYGPWCYGVSLGLFGFSQNNTAPMSEDCLTLNIVRPRNTRRHAKLPVAVWIHGGGFSEGSAADQRYNGSFLVQESTEMGTPIIFVSLNYRLGIFGFMAGPALEQTGDTNIAIHDQRMALTWIQENIAAFGGDPDHVTIFGESAGAASVGFHLIAYGGKDSGLFHAAIAESGGPFAYQAFRNATQKAQEYQNTLQRANCTAATDPLDCLKSVPANVLNTFNALVQAHPIIDGTLVEDYSSKLLAKGAFRKVPLLIGTNRNEGTSMFGVFEPVAVTTESKFASVVQSFSPGGTIPNATLEKWSAAYQDAVDQASIAGLGTVAANPGPRYGALYGQSTLWIGDSMFAAGRRYANQMWTEYGTPSYAYLFDAVPHYADPKIYGAAHFAEVSFAFNNVEGIGYDVNPFGTSDQQQAAELYRLAKVMSRMWISFFVHKTPNHHGVPGVAHWPSYSKTNATNIVLSGSSDPYTTPDTWRAFGLQTFIDLASYLGR